VKRFKSEWLSYLMNTHVTHILKFGIVGFVTAVIYFVIMWFGESVMALNYLLAISIAYIFSTTFHFFANRHFTFKAGDEEKFTQLIKYLILWIINYALTMLIVIICVERVHLSSYMGVCISVIATVSVGYFLSRYWVFKSRESIS